MFIWAFLITSVIAFLVLSFFSGYAAHMGRPTPTNWLLLTGSSLVIGFVVGLLLQGIVSLF